MTILNISQFVSGLSLRLVSFGMPRLCNRDFSEMFARKFDIFRGFNMDDASERDDSVGGASTIDQSKLDASTFNHLTLNASTFDYSTAEGRPVDTLNSMTESPSYFSDLNSFDSTVNHPNLHHPNQKLPLESFHFYFETDPVVHVLGECTHIPGHRIALESMDRWKDWTGHRIFNYERGFRRATHSWRESRGVLVGGESSKVLIE